MLDIIVAWAVEIIAAIGYPGIFALMALESACIPIPSEVVMPFAGYLSFAGRLGFWETVLAGSLGCMFGSAIAYWIGLKGGRAFIRKYGSYFWLDHSHLELAEKWFSKYGDHAVLWSRMMPVVRTFISLPAGIGKMDFRKLVAYSFIGSVPWCILLTYVGFSLGPYWDAVLDIFRMLDLAVVAAIIIAAAYFIFYKKRISHRK